MLSRSRGREWERTHGDDGGELLVIADEGEVGAALDERDERGRLGALGGLVEDDDAKVGVLCVLR